MSAKKAVPAIPAQGDPSLDRHFSGKAESVRLTYDRLLKAVGKFGPLKEEPKKTSIHIVRKSAFAGVSTRKDCLILTIKSKKDIRSPRVHKHEQASAGRWHVEVRLSSPKDVDGELLEWLRQSYEISA